MSILDLLSRKVSIPAPEAALRGRDEPIPTAEKHFVNGRPLKGPYPDNLKTAVFGLTRDQIVWGHKTPIQHIYGAGPA